MAPRNFASVSLRSRYIAAVHRLSNPVDAGTAWVDDLHQLLRTETFDLLIPCVDSAVLPLNTHREYLEGLTRLAIPTKEQIGVLFDKVRTREAAAALGLNLSPALYPPALDAGSELEGREVLQRLGTPVVVKPRRSVNSDAVHRQELVQIATTAEELGAAICGRRPGSFFLEAFFAGTGVGVSVLADRGVITQVFQHHRIHQAARGGSSAYRVSAPLSRDLVTACEKIVAHLHYTGVAMFEFRRNFATGAWVLLEVNARPWGSMPLAWAAGVDFPYAWFRLLVDGTVLARQSYRPGVYGRNLDLDISYAAKRVAAADRGIVRAVLLGRWMAGFGRLLTRQERLDELVIDDPAPAVAQLGALGARAAKAAWRRLPGQKSIWRTVARAKVRRALRKTLRAGGSPAIAFVCYGNICRSAFAERVMLGARTPLAGQLTVRSAGTFQVAGRASPSEAIAAARRRGIDLATHRSRCVTPELLGAVSVLFAFDASNIAALRAQFDAIPCPIVLLGSLIDTRDPKAEIRDPYGGDPAMFDCVFALIEQAVGVLRACVTEVLVAKSPT